MLDHDMVLSSLIPPPGLLESVSYPAFGELQPLDFNASCGCLIA